MAQPMPDLGKTYVCSSCGEIFEAGWSEEEATAELANTFPGADKVECAIVCDDCY
jgi:hypothetical protein